MTTNEMDALLQSQKSYFQSGATTSVSFRIEILLKLRAAIQKNEAAIADALYRDLGKSKEESYLCETGMALSELTYLIKHTPMLAKRSVVKTPLAQFPARSFTQSVPYGNTLIMSPWNYPFLLTIGPLADALAAGNTAIIKPSAYSPNTAKLIEKLLGELFEKRYVAVVTGGREENAYLLEQPFDFVFFTGSPSVGKEVLRKCAERLTPAVLELGGKSPVIVDSSAKIPLAAKRIVFGKFLNCGQTCVAPDYILCDRAVKDQLVSEIKKQIKLQFGENPLLNQNYGHIVNQKHYARIESLIDENKVVYGGEKNAHTLQIAPTVMDNVSWDDAIMQEEIFGPILPILTFNRFSEVYDLLKNRPKPLALYLFTQKKSHRDFVVSRCNFGGGCINDTIIHLATDQMGFGGVGESGMGAYHGKAGFDCFSHKKSIVDKKTWLDLPIRYQPYTSWKNTLVHRFLR